MFYTRIVSSIESGEILDFDVLDYDGPVSELKKGREQTEAAANQANGQAAENQGVQNTALGKVNKFDDQLLATKPGELSPYAQSQYQSDTRNIDNTYGDLKAQGLKGLSYRGFGAAPTGMEASITNTANRDAGAAKTGAYENALHETLGEGLEGVRNNQTQEQLFNPLAADQTAAQAGLARSQEGSTFGDITSGLEGLTSSFGNVFSPIKFPHT